MKEALIELLHNRKIVLLVDMDNTIVDYSAPIAETLKDALHVDVRPDNWTDWCTNSHSKKIQKDKQKEDGFFYSLKPINGSINALNEMEEMGFTVFIVSSPSISSTTCHSDKVRWLKEYMGDNWARRLILTKDKTIVLGDYLIDDRIDVTGVYDEEKLWKHILFSQHYNAQIQDKPRVSGWDNWIETMYNEIIR